MRAMIEPDERALVLRLLPQHLNLVSFSRMLDHLTDPSIDTRLVSSCRAIDELVIYEVDMLGGHAEFHIPGVEDHIFCGAAFCREGEELSIFGLFGRPPTVAEPRIERIDPANLHPGKRFLYERGATVDMSDQPLLGDTRFAPLLLMARVDLAGEVVQVRYVLEETKDTFRVASDDPDEIAALAAIRMADPRRSRNMSPRSKPRRPCSNSCSRYRAAFP